MVFSIQCRDYFAQFAKSLGRAELVCFIKLPLLHTQSMLTLSSASPLNGQAAELWSSDQEEFKKQVIKRHKLAVDDDDENLDF